MPGTQRRAISWARVGSIDAATMLRGEATRDYPSEPLVTNSYVIGLYHQGEALIRYGPRSLRIGEGTTSFYPPEMTATVVRRFTDISRFSALLLDRDAWRTAWMDVFERPAPEDGPTVIFDPGIAAAYRRLSDGCFGGADPIAQDTALSALIVEVGRVHRSGSLPGVGHEPTAVRLAREYLMDHLDSRVDLADLARVTGLSKWGLVRSFGRSVGIPPHQYQLRARLWRARQLLMAGESVSSVAQTCGFHDQSHLNRRFVRLFGRTPAAVSRENRR
jgi:AraC-like DNA-binding protein